MAALSKGIKTVTAYGIILVLLTGCGSLLTSVLEPEEKPPASEPSAAGTREAGTESAPYVPVTESESGFELEPEHEQEPKPESGFVHEPEPKGETESKHEPKQESGSGQESRSEQETRSELPPVTLNMDLAGRIGGTNGGLRAAFGDEADCEIWHGDSPVASYYPNYSRSSVTFWLDGGYDEMMETWGKNQGAGGHTQYVNFWPDSFTVVAIEVWMGTIDELYNAVFPVTPDMMAESFRQISETRFVPVDDELDESWIFDTWCIDYELDGYLMEATFLEEGGDIYLFHTRLTGIY